MIDARADRPPPSRHAAAVVVACHIVAGLAAIGPSLLGGRPPVLWLPVGIAFGYLMRHGLALVPAFLASLLLLSYFAHATTVVGLAFGVGVTTATAASAALLRRADFRPDFGRTRDVMLFVGGVVLLALLSLPLPLWALHSASAGAPTDLATAARDWAWWVTSGALLGAPLTLTWRDATLGSAPRRELVAWVLCVAAVAAALPLVPPAFIRAPVYPVCALLMLWAVSRFSLPVAMAGAIAISASYSACVAFDAGLLRGIDLDRSKNVFWNFVALLIVTTLVLHTALQRRSRAERRFHLFFDRSPVPLVLSNDAGEVIEANAAAAVQFGIRPAPRPDMSAAAGAQGALLPPATAELVHERHLDSQGGARYVDSASIRLDLEDGTAELKFLLDVTDRVRLQRALEEVSLREQQRLGREIHDGLGQELTGLAMLADGFASSVERGGQVHADELRQLATLARSALGSCREVAHGLSPLDHAHGDLAAALRLLIESIRGSTSADVRLEATRELPGLPSTMANHVYRIVQEAVTNALRHARARCIVVTLGGSGDELDVSVTDDGDGFAADDAALGLGLYSMRQRALSMGGALTIRSVPGEGTFIRGRWPIGQD